jgi:ABC-type multidrug transport system ATPase subunit
MLTAQGLTKSFGDAFTLGPVDLSCARAEVLCVLGKNGSGKSTFFQLLTGNLDATAGQIQVGGERMTVDAATVKRRLGYLPQDPLLPRWATAEELLSYMARLYGFADGKARVGRSLAYWDSESFARKPLATLSYGMQRRVGLALATIHDPETLILDEPHSGLDLFHVRALDDEILRRRKAGRLTIFSTHVAPFAAALADRALVVEAGKVRELAGWQGAASAARTAQIEACFFAKNAPSAASPHA